MPLTLVTAPAVEPVSLADLKLQIGLSPYEDADPVKSDMLSRQLRRLITVARVQCEEATKTAYITQTWRLALKHWPHREREYVRHHVHEILLPKPPFQSIVSFGYTDLSGDPQVLDTGDYQIDTGGGTQPACLAPLLFGYWPFAQPLLDSIQIVFTCGYGDTPAAVPATVQQAILLLAEDYYNNGATDRPMPRAVAALLSAETNWNS